jgi:hypothetical protein
MQVEILKTPAGAEMSRKMLRREAGGFRLAAVSSIIHQRARGEQRFL